MRTAPRREAHFSSLADAFFQNEHSASTTAKFWGTRFTLQKQVAKRVQAIGSDGGACCWGALPSLVSWFVSLCLFVVRGGVALLDFAEGHPPTYPPPTSLSNHQGSRRRLHPRFSQTQDLKTIWQTSPKSSPGACRDLPGLLHGFTLASPSESPQDARRIWPRFPGTFARFPAQE